MDISSHLSEIKKQFSKLLSICDPKNVSELRPPIDKREKYEDLLKDIKNHIDAIESAFINGVLMEGAVQSDQSRDYLLFYKEKIMPRCDDLDCAFEKLNPSDFELHQMFYKYSIPSGANGKTRSTFYAGVEKINEMIEDNSDLECHFSVTRAFNIINSKLIDFAPDKWLDNARHLYPIRTSRNKMLIPVQVNQRMIELYRSYLFGNWLSVLTLSRSILEYVILDTLHKFKIEATYDVTQPVVKKKPRNLSRLIDEISDYLPLIKDDMESVRDYGNELYIQNIKKQRQFLNDSRQRKIAC